MKGILIDFFSLEVFNHYTLTTIAIIWNSIYPNKHFVKQMFLVYFGERWFSLSISRTTTSEQWPVYVVKSFNWHLDVVSFLKVGLLQVEYCVLKCD